MIAAVPAFLIDVATILGALAAAVTGAGVLARLPLVRFVWQRLVTRPLGEWFSLQVAEATEDIREAAKVTAHHVRYHLGTNDTTMPWHERLSRLEEVAGLEPVPQQEEHGRG